MFPPARFNKSIVLVLILLSLIHVEGCTRRNKRKSHDCSGSAARAPDYGYSNIFDVLAYGAKADGFTDDSKAFLAAWQAACRVESAVVEVPAEFRFLVNPIVFMGPCKENIIFQIDGTIVAPMKPWMRSSGLLDWIQFKRVQGATIQGNGLIDGRGSVWWGSPDYQLTRKHTKPMPAIKPTALRFYGSYNVTVRDITIQNSPQCHLKFDSCSSVDVSNVTISSPANSPNTDGIHLQNSQDVEIHHSTIGCGDDCVSIQTGCRDIRAHHINCGPGHGISIGSLGKDKTKACVSNVTVHDVSIQDALFGVRIKTWQGGSGFVRGVSFGNIEVWNVKIPIMIDQFYCDKRVCRNQTSGVAISNISFIEIRGTYAYKAVHLACSDTMPCTDIDLSDIELQAVARVQNPFCWNTYGQSQAPTLPPLSCLQSGRPYNKAPLHTQDKC
ncbi:hypothetical protein SUGI_0276710 [Cryptomeria japonica]|uniref:polygalacturonase At1g48100 n=1 Tax=Cryptomeria japonica TaxID=3369 RepID=UPI002408CF1C|nr:polygalacturonase At1g48100 [Cryptomeria japonica]GLJ16346.1 hypothetical protein SUGI_0276710 [Cryptomeria japonica]